MVMEALVVLRELANEYEVIVQATFLKTGLNTALYEMIFYPYAGAYFYWKAKTYFAWKLYLREDPKTLETSAIAISVQ